MSYDITIEQDVQVHLLNLGLIVPQGLAILPNNLGTASSIAELNYPESVSTVRKIWRKAGIDISLIEPDGIIIPYSEEKFVEWLGPTIFISFSLWSQNPGMVTIALNLISNYLLDFFKGIPKAQRKVQIDIIRETKPSGEEFRHIHYEGSEEGLKDLLSIFKEA